MTCMYMNNDHTMSYHASACAAAASSCAHMSAMCSAANMTLARILDAIFMASIFVIRLCLQGTICSLICPGCLKDMRPTLA